MSDNAKQILLVNRDGEQLDRLQRLLDTTPHRILIAENGRQAVAHLRAAPVDWVVSSIELGDIDGWRLARMVRSGIFRCRDDIPFIVLANTWCEHIAELTAREFGINQILSLEQSEQLLDLIQQASLPAIADLERRSLLAIEDNPETCQLVSRMLGSRFDVDVASNGTEGLASWLEKRHSLVLLDVMLPGMSGQTILHKIMAEHPLQPVVVMTAHSSMSLAEDMILKGAADFIAKPFRAEQLRRVCESAARREDFMVSNAQFEAKVIQLEKSRAAYKGILTAHQYLLDNLGSVVIELDAEGRIRFLNQAWERMTGYLIGASQGRLLTDFVERYEVGGVATECDLAGMLNSGRNSLQLEFRLRNHFDKVLWVESRFEVGVGRDSTASMISGTIEDISLRKKAQQDLEYLAMHDGLTGLYNRRYFESELRHHAAMAARGNGTHCLLYIDLDHFKVINDTLGHHQGDVVLKAVAGLLSERIRETDLLCRIGGDEFALLLPNTTPEQGLHMANLLCKLIAEYHCEIEDQIFCLNCSIGLANINGAEATAEEYMKQADIALYAAKNQGRNLAHLYDDTDESSSSLKASLEWSRRLQQAVANDQLVLYFQPVVHVKTGHVGYYEALVRLVIDGEIVMPGDFIPPLERAGDMRLLDKQVISKAIKYLHDYPQIPRMAINLSAQGFSDEGLASLITEKLQKYQVSADRLIFELTESASLSNISITSSTIKVLNQLGCGFSIDDFGTGFSTFSYLKKLPAQSVKIDGSFVVELVNNPVDKALVKAIYEVANALDKYTVAEYVENHETLKLIREIGITYAQGFFLGRPMPVDTLFS